MLNIVPAKNQEFIRMAIHFVSYHLVTYPQNNVKAFLPASRFARAFNVEIACTEYQFIRKWTASAFVFAIIKTR